MCCFPAWGIMGNKVMRTKSAVIKTTTSASVCGMDRWTDRLYCHAHVQYLYVSTVRWHLKTLRQRSNVVRSGKRLIWWTQGGCFLTRWPSRVTVSSRLPGLLRDSFSFSSRIWREGDHIHQSAVCCVLCVCMWNDLMMRFSDGWQQNNSLRWRGV